MWQFVFCGLAALAGLYAVIVAGALLAVRTRARRLAAESDGTFGYA
jgi:hypothetical protein